MMKRRWRFNGKTSENAASASATTSSSPSKEEDEEDVEWEMRPGGMLVQKRSENCGDVLAAAAAAVPNLRVRVVYGALQYEVSVNSQTTFGELKKLLTIETGLQVGEQRLFFRGKERGNGKYLDLCGVKNRSKVVLMEDPESMERRIIEMRKNTKIQTAYRLINDISVEVGQLANQVSAIEKSIANGTKVPELQITTLIEMLMRQAVKLDSISADGDACEKKNLEGKKVQKCVEILDVLKLSNVRVKSVIVSRKWETFDPPPASTSKWEIFY